jgi:hypothetical protein
MILNTREFDVNGINVIVGHDRETGKRYFCIEANNAFLLDPINKIKYIYSIGIESLKSIFWIE